MRAIRSKLIATGSVILIGAAGLVGLTGAAAPADVEVVKLSPAEAWVLQQRVDQQLNNSVGGKQTGPNTVAYYDGTIIVTLTLPGEEFARAVNNDFQIQADLCASQWACIYDNTNFAGDNALRDARFNCGEINLANIGWLNRVSSIHNNQTSNTQTLLLDNNHKILNANRAPSKVNDLGVESANDADFWVVC